MMDIVRLLRDRAVFILIDVSVFEWETALSMKMLKIWKTHS